MKKELAIIHLLSLAHAYKNFLHWQAVCRIGLGSLFLDGRIKKDIRDEISDLIANRRILDYAVLARVPTQTWS